MPLTFIAPDTPLELCLLLFAIRLSEQASVDANPQHAKQWYWSVMAGLPQGRN